MSYFRWWAFSCRNELNRQNQFFNGSNICSAANHWVFIASALSSILWSHQGEGWGGMAGWSTGTFLLSSSLWLKVLHLKNVVWFSLIVTTAEDCSVCPMTPWRSRFILHTYCQFLKLEIPGIFSNFSNTYGYLLQLAKEPPGKGWNQITVLLSRTNTPSFLNTTSHKHSHYLCIQVGFFNLLSVALIRDNRQTTNRLSETTWPTYLLLRGVPEGLFKDGDVLRARDVPGPGADALLQCTGLCSHHQLYTHAHTGYCGEMAVHGESTCSWKPSFKSMIEHGHHVDGWPLSPCGWVTIKC